MKKQLFALTLLALGLSACSAKIESGKNEPGAHPYGEPQSEFSSPAITGPNVEGNWISDCAASRYGGARIVALSLKGQKFSYTQKTFQDRTCQMPDSEPLIYSGIYQFSAIDEKGVYTIDYHYDYNDTNYHLDGQKLLLTGSNLFISEMIWSSRIDLSLDLPLYRSN